MTGKELLLGTLRHQKMDNVPWVPFAGIHAGKFLGYSAREVLTDGAKLFDSLMEVNRCYQPDGQPVMFDLQVEAEILGCNLVLGRQGASFGGFASPGGDDGRPG